MASPTPQAPVRAGAGLRAVGSMASLKASTDQPHPPGFPRSITSPDTSLHPIEDLLEEENRAWADGADRSRSVPVDGPSSSRWKLPWSPTTRRSHSRTASSTKSHSEKITETPQVLTPRESTDFSDQTPTARLDQGTMLRGAGGELQSEIQNALAISIATSKDEEALRFARDREFAIEISRAEASRNMASMIPVGPSSFGSEVVGVAREPDVWSGLSMLPGPAQVPPNYQASGSSRTSHSNNSPTHDPYLPSEEEQIRILLRRSMLER